MKPTTNNDTHLNTLLMVIKHTPAAVAMYDRQMNYIACSQRFLIDYGLENQFLIGKNHYEIFPEITDRWKEIHKRCLAGAYEKSDGEIFPRADGKIEYVRWEIQPWKDADNEIGGIIIFSEVITEQIQNEMRIQNLTRLYATLSQINLTIVKVKHKQELFDAICKIAIKYGKFGLAWIGEVDQEQNTAVPVAIEGLRFDQMPFQKIDFSTAPFENSPIHHSIQTGEITYCIDMQNDPLMQHWSKVPEVASFHTAAVLPFRSNQSTVGFLKIYSTQEFIFEDPQEQQLLQEMRDDISFALDTLFKEQLRLKTEIALKVSEANLVEAQKIAKIGNWKLDILSDSFFASEELYHIFEEEKSNPENLLNSIKSLLLSKDNSSSQTNYQKAREAGEPFDVDYQIITPKGNLKYLNVKGYTEKNENNEVTTLIGTTQDVTEFKLTEEKVRRQLSHQKALRDIDFAIMSSSDIHMTLKIIAEKILQLLEVDAVSFSTFNPYTFTFEYVTGGGFFGDEIQTLPRRLGEGIIGEACLNRRMVEIHNLEKKENLFPATFHKDEQFSCYFVIPLITKGNINGILELFVRDHQKHNQEWQDFLNLMANQAALAIENTNLFDNLHRSNIELRLAYDATIEGWSRAMDLRDRETEGHTQRVTSITLRMAQAAGFTDEELVQIRRGALLHDIGKLGVPDEILFKPGKLDEEEWKIMRQHPVYAYDMLVSINYLKPALDIPYCHHEKWDGSGYPRGLKGEQIPLAARLFAVVDVWDALRSDRPYRESWPEEKVLNHIRSLSGTHFDPKAVQLFEQVLAREKF